MRRNALARTEGDHLIDVAGAARLRAAAANDGWRAIWKDLKAEERLLPEIALAGAAAFEAAGEANEAAKVLEAAIAVKFNPALVAAYARCDAEQVSRRLAKAETWLQQRPTDPDLLTALGMLCLNGQLWGQAERYLSLIHILFEDRVMKIGQVRIGNGVNVGPRSTILYDTRVEDGARLGPLTLVLKGESIPAGQAWMGSPATPWTQR